MKRTIEIPEYKICEKFKVPSKGTGLIIVDMQNDFCTPRGKLFVPLSRETIPNIQKLLEIARKKRMEVFFTQDWHEKKDPEFEIWGEHSVAGTWGAEIIDELKPLENEHLIKKLRYDAFFGTSLDHLLRIYKIENLVITGTVSNICVLHTAGSARLAGYNIIVPVDAISALTPFDYSSSLRQIDFLYKGILVKTQGLEIE